MNNSELTEFKLKNIAMAIGKDEEIELNGINCKRDITPLMIATTIERLIVNLATTVDKNDKSLNKSTDQHGINGKGSSI